MAKRRGNSEGSIYRRQDGRWAATISLGYEGGKRRRKTFYGQTRAEVAGKLLEASANRNKGMPTTTSSPTVGEFLGDWYRHGVEVKDWSPATARRYRAIIEAHLMPEIGRIRLEKLTPRRVQALLDDRSARGLAPQTVKNVRAALRSVLSLAMRWELVGRNVAALTEAPRVERPKVVPLSPAEVRRFLAAVEHHRLGPLFTVATTLGIRQSEAIGLRWGDVDLEANLLHIRRRTYRVDGRWHTGRTKTGQERTIPFPDEIGDAFRKHRLQQLQERMRAPTWEDTDLVFTNLSGGPLYGPTVTRVMQQLMVEAGMERKRFHDLRHTAASLMLAMGVRLETIQETLGHASFRTTKDLYAHVMPEIQLEAADKMGEFLRGEA